MVPNSVNSVELEISQPVEVRLSTSRSNTLEHILTETLGSAGDVSIATNAARPSTSGTQRIDTRDPKNAPLLEVLDGSSNGDDDIVHPTGAKFYSFVMALALSLVLTGIVSLVLSKIMHTFGSDNSTGWEYPQHCYPDHH